MEDPFFCDPRVLAPVLDGVDACIHVADMNTHKILFINCYGKNIWGNIQGKPCWSVFHQGMTSPCAVCINKHLIDEKDNPLGVYPWEYFSPVNNRWYDCRGRAIRLPDGRLVTVKVAMDITERKQSQEKLTGSAKRLEKVHELGTAILANTSPGDVARRLLRYFRSLLLCQHASVLTIDHDARTCMVLGIDEEGRTGLSEGTVFAFEDVLARDNFADGHIPVRRDIAAVNERTRFEGLLAGAGYRSCVQAPMRVGQKMTGFFNIAFIHSHIVSDEQMEIVREVATPLALALKQAQLLERVAEYSRDLERKIDERTGALEVLNSLLRNDLNRRKRVIEELRQSEERYRIVIESSSDGVAIIKGEKIVFTNGRYNEIFGYDDPGEIHGKDLLLTIHPDDAAAVRERNARLQLGEDVPLKCECKGFRKDGSTVYIEASAAPINCQGGRAALVYIRDITERKEAEERLLKSEKQYRDLVDNSLVGIYQTDTEGNIIYVNHAFANMLGFDSPDEVRCEKACRYYADPEDRKEFVERLSKARKIPGIELELSTRLGERRSVLLSAALDGNILSGMAKDITSRKKAEEELKEKSLCYEEANAALRVLLRQRDHDRNEVEQKILGNVKELIYPYLDKLRLMQTTDEQKTCLDIIESNIRDIVSPFMQKMTAINLHFTPAEIRVAAFIRDGKTVKEISGILAVSESAVNLHRQHIRDKLSLTGKKINLRTFLLSLQ